MFRNVATKIALFAFDTTSGAAKTGDAANITPYVSKDYGTVTVLGTTTATEMDATNAKGWYLFTVAQAESNGDALLFTGESTTANVSIVGQYIFTTPNRFTTLVIDAAGLADANAVKVGPTGAGTAQTARDVGASVLLSTGTGAGQLDFTSGVVKANLAQILGTALTETAGQIAAAFKKFFNVATPVSTMDALTLVATATNLTNAPTSGDLTATMKTSVTTAATAATPVAASVTGTVGSVTGNVGGSVASVTAAVGITGDLSATMKTSVTTAATAATPTAAAVTGAVGSVTGAVGSVTGLTASDVGAIKTKTDNLPASPAAVGAAMTLTGAYDYAKGTAAMVESYAADGAAPTPEQMQFMIWALLAERAIASTTLTAKKLDGSTPAMTFTLDDATNPSSQTRTT